MTAELQLMAIQAPFGWPFEECCDEPFPLLLQLVVNASGSWPSVAVVAFGTVKLPKQTSLVEVVEGRLVEVALELPP